MADKKELERKIADLRQSISETEELLKLKELEEKAVNDWKVTEAALNLGMANTLTDMEEKKKGKLIQYG